MQEKSLRIVFMGTPEFAVASLDALVSSGFNIVAVITAPDKPAGRGMKLQQSAVKKYALEKELLVLQPTHLKSAAFVSQLKEINPDIQVVVAFRMLPEVVWNLPRLGTINLHASLLPQYRGAAPINWSIINGEKETGVTTFKLQHEIDTGNILLSKKVIIEENDNAGVLHDKLMTTGAALLVQTLKGIASGEIREIDQQHIAVEGEIHHAPKIHSEDCEINWDSTTEKVFNLIRGLSPFPGAFTFLQSKRIKVLEAKREYASPRNAPGNYETDRKTYLKFATKDGYIFLTRIKPEGKSEMSIEDFLRGKRDL